jgi:hypothetical protein
MRLLLSLPVLLCPAMYRMFYRISVLHPALFSPMPASATELGSKMVAVSSSFVLTPNRCLDVMF